MMQLRGALESLAWVKAPVPWSGCPEAGFLGGALGSIPHFLVYGFALCRRGCTLPYCQREPDFTF